MFIYKVIFLIVSGYILADGCHLPTTHRLEETVGWTFGYGCQGILQFPSSKNMAYTLSIHPWKPHQVFIPPPAQEELKRRTSMYSLRIFQMRFFCDFAYIIVTSSRRDNVIQWHYCPLSVYFTNKNYTVLYFSLSVSFRHPVKVKMVLIVRSRRNSKYEMFTNNIILDSYDIFPSHTKRK
jgi:hypothetical protein